MPTDSTSVSVMDSCYERLKEDVLSFREKGKVVCWHYQLLSKMSVDSVFDVYRLEGGG